MRAPAVVDLLGLRRYRFQYGKQIGHQARLERDGSLWLRLRSRITEYDEWPDGESELRAVGDGHYYGRFLLDPFPRPLPSEGARLVAVTLAAEAGAAPNTPGAARK
ncbi:hypothetical protein [Streptomyces sp. NPDC054797]